MPMSKYRLYGIGFLLVIFYIAVRLLDVTDIGGTEECVLRLRARPFNSWLGVSVVRASLFFVFLLICTFHIWNVNSFELLIYGQYFNAIHILCKDRRVFHIKRFFFLFIWHICTLYNWVIRAEMQFLSTRIPVFVSTHIQQLKEVLIVQHFTHSKLLFLIKYSGCICAARVALTKFLMEWVISAASKVISIRQSL